MTHRGADTFDFSPSGDLLSATAGGHTVTYAYVGSDQTGTPKVVFSADGTVLKRLAYDSFGNPSQTARPPSSCRSASPEGSRTR